MTIASHTTGRTDHDLTEHAEQGQTGLNAPLTLVVPWGTLVDHTESRNHIKAAHGNTSDRSRRVLRDRRRLREHPGTPLLFPLCFLRFLCVFLYVSFALPCPTFPLAIHLASWPAAGLQAVPHVPQVPAGRVSLNGVEVNT